MYSSPGIYTLSITARQSDGQNVTGITKISVGQTVIPPTLPVTLTTLAPGGPRGPVMVISAPVLTLLEPVIDRMNVKLNGNLNAVSPGVIIDSVIVDWNDRNIMKSTDLPVTPQYSVAWIFTISITGNQSDGQLTTRKITLYLKEEVPVLPGPTPSGLPPDDPTAYPIIIAMAIIGVLSLP